MMWILAAVVGWNATRDVIRSLGLLATVGGVWGAIRAAVYMALGEQLSADRIAVMILVCMAIMIAAGIAVRSMRSLIEPR